MNVKLQPLISVFESPCLADSGSCSLCKEMLICFVFLIDSLILQTLDFYLRISIMLRRRHNSTDG